LVVGVRSFGANVSMAYFRNSSGKALEVAIYSDGRNRTSDTERN
jgi:hypothetical protein